MSFCDRFNWKFWANWDLLGRKKIASLEKRIEKLEKEVLPSDAGFSTLFLRMWTNLYDTAKEPKTLTLREKVGRIQEHLNLQFETQSEKIVTKVVKAKRK